MTDRAKLEADIAYWTEMRDEMDDVGPTDRVLARLRRDLAKIDGPAEGFVRHWYVDDGMTGAIRCSRDRAKREAAKYANGFVFFVDLPIRTVSVIEGEVCDG